MSFQRRWFLTAAGSAFLASITGVLEAKPAKGGGPARKKPAKVDDAIEDLTQSVLAGYSKVKMKTDEGVIRDALRPVYHSRYRKRHDAMADAKYDALWKFAGVLGSLTQQCLQHEKDGSCGWDKNAGATLRQDHVDRAREILGFVLNSKVNPNGGKDGCYKVVDELRAREIDQPCPLCEMTP